MSSSSTASWSRTSSGSRPGPGSAAPGAEGRRAGASLPGRLFVFCLLAFLLLGGGRIASSDGHTMYLLGESLLGGRLSIPAGNGKVGREGRLYTKADPGQAVAALPLVAAGRASAALLPEGPLRTYWPRAVASTLNAVVGAAAVTAFLLVVRSLGYAPRTALVLSLGLGFSTALLPYTKSFMREPLLMLCLLAAFLELRRNILREDHAAREAGGARGGAAGPLQAGLWLGAGMLVKASFALNVPLLLAYLAARPGGDRPVGGRVVAAFLAGPAAAALLLALYNWARFGSALETGYDPTVDRFTTPLLVGLYGQLLSSGKSIFLYAPLGLAALWGFGGLARHHRPEALAAAAILVANGVFHAKFASWAGEGSWGPRYLVAFLPFLVLPAAELVQSGRAWRRRAAALALAAGVAVQAGGTAIYFGSYMRELGEYPYERPFSDPLFMVRSHFVPNYSPVVGHWRLLVRNAGLLIGPERPRIAPRVEVEDRLPVGEGERGQLRYVVDFWFCYLLYAGVPWRLVAVPLVVLVLLTVWAGLRLRAAARGADPLPDPGG